MKLDTADRMILDKQDIDKLFSTSSQKKEHLQRKGVEFI